MGRERIELGIVMLAMHELSRCALWEWYVIGDVTYRPRRMRYVSNEYRSFRPFNSVLAFSLVSAHRTISSHLSEGGGAAD